jgi:hypothetical protein
LRLDLLHQPRATGMVPDAFGLGEIAELFFAHRFRHLFRGAFQR